MVDASAAGARAVGNNEQARPVSPGPLALQIISGLVRSHD